MTDWQRRALPLALLCALAGSSLLRLPSLDGGLRTDDYVQRAMLDGGFPLQRGPHDLFWFSGRSDAEAAALLDAGYHPWWTAPGYRLAMLRPLSSLSLWLEHRLGLDAREQHLVSLIWLGLAVCAAALLLSRLLGPPVAATAIVIFALDGAHAAPLSWIANRSALVSSTFALLALWAHVRWRRDRWRPGAPLAMLGLIAALAAGEYGLGIVGFIVAFELLAPSVPRAGRWRSLSLVAGAAVLYLALHVAGGYGVRHSGLYLSPFSDPLGYALAAIARVPVLVGDLVLGVPARYWNVGHPWRSWLITSGWFEPTTWLALPSWRAWHVTTGLGAIALAAWLVASGRLRSKEAPWLAAGTLLSLVPMAVSLPGERLLGVAAFGASALIAMGLAAGLDAVRGAAPALHGGTRIVVVAVVGATLAIHVALAGFRAHRDATAWVARAEAARRWALEAPIPAGSEVILLGASDFSTEAHVPWIRRAHGLPEPRSYRRLAGARPYDLHRISDDTLELESLTTDLRGTTAGSLYRARDEPLRPGTIAHVPGMRIEVRQMWDGEPRRIRYRFDVPLEQAGHWLVPSREGLVRLELPPTGQTLRLPQPPMPH